MSKLYYPTTANAVQKTLGAELLAGVTASATLNNTTSIQNKAGVFVVDRVDSNGVATPSKREYIAFTGTSGSTVVTLTRGLAGSTDQVHAVGAIVEFVNDIAQQQAILDALGNLVDPSDVSPKLTVGSDADGDIYYRASSKLARLAKGTANQYLRVNAGATAPEWATLLDEDDMATNSATNAASQQSIKAYADTKAPLANPSFTGTVSVAGAISQAGTADHITITPGSSKLVKIAVLQQNDTTNAYVNSSVVLTGWGHITGNGTAVIAETVTFGITFAAAPIVISSALGYKDSSDPTAIGQLARVTSNESYSTNGDITTTNFSIGLRNTTATFGATTRFGYTWIAIGSLT